MTEVLRSLGQLFQAIVDLLSAQGRWVAPVLLLAGWVAWWLWGANWRHVWPTLAKGGWAPVVLLTLVAALVWAGIAPGTYDFAGLLSVPNFWWQFVAVGLIVGLALFCGWLQGVYSWAPAELNFTPPVHHHGHDDHGHGHDHGHHEPQVKHHVENGDAHHGHH